MQRNIAEMVSTLKLSASSRCVKYLMFIFNLLFVITGIILLSVGATIHAVYRNYPHFLDDKYLSVPNLLIAIGTLIFIIAFFGCCGAVRENYCMIVAFAVLMVLIFILELSGGIAGYVLRSDAHDMLQDKMLGSMKKYNTNGSEIQEVWDDLQREFSCCGTVNASDWLDILKNGDKLPNSCCVDQVGASGGYTCDIKYLNTFQPGYPGCLNTFVAFIQSHAVQLGGVAIGTAFVQCVGIWFAIFLAKSIKSSYETV